MAGPHESIDRDMAKQTIVILKVLLGSSKSDKEKLEKAENDPQLDPKVKALIRKYRELVCGSPDVAVLILDSLERS